MTFEPLLLPGVVEAIAFPLPSDRYGCIAAAAVRVRGSLSKRELMGYA